MLVTKGCLKCTIGRIVVFAAFLVFIGGIIYNVVEKPRRRLSQAQVSATIVNDPREIQPFHFIDDEGKPFTNVNLKDHWTFLFFGFTNCPSLCPTTMDQLAKLYEELTVEHKAPIPQVVMVSIDPDRDTREKMHAYVKGFNAHFIGVVGSKEQVQQITHQLGIVYMREEGKSKTDYVLDHSGTVILVNPKGRVLAFFSLPHHAQKMASDYTYITSHA